MFKFKIDKEAVELLCKVMKQNGLSEIEVKSGRQSIKLSKNNNEGPNIFLQKFQINYLLLNLFTTLDKKCRANYLI